MLKHILTFVFILFISKQIYSQSDNFYSLYQYNTNIINPAYAGSHESLDIGLLYNWGTVHLFDFDSPDGSSHSFLANVHSPIGGNFGGGFSYESTEIGPIKEKDIELNLSYKLNLENSTTLSFGINSGLSFIDSKLSNLQLIDENDPYFPTNIKSQLTNLGLGLYYQSTKFYTGIAYAYYFGDEPHTITSGNNILSIGINNFSLINGFAGYVFDLSDKVKLKPSMIAFFNSSNNETWLYLSGNIYLVNTLEVGINYSFTKAVALTINSPLIAKTFKLGLSIDFLEKYELQDKSYQNFTLFTNFNIDAFGKGNTKTYF